MSDWSDVAVLIPTYNRPETCERAVRLLREHLRYAGVLRILVGNDGDGSLDLGGQADAIIPGPHNGLGANLNNLIRHADADYLFQMDDDHLLLQPLNLDPHVERLRGDHSSGWIRLMGIGSHRYEARLDGMYWRVRWDSPELYITSNRPHLKHRRFHAHFGWYPEGVRLAETEESFCHQCRDTAFRHGGPDVLVPLDVLTESGWDHVGDSWQSRGL